ncbi:glycosyltransferase family 2 protein [Gordonia sp. DT219]|uniref:glycosyltransferase family 2 protein n=1 Tax=Gordonia sp. DT219 TaxID=3416658 RepID=UPI003CEC3629
MQSEITVIIPCRNEAFALPAVLQRIPIGYSALVVDNGSTDATAEVASRHGARVITEERPGYGSAVHAGVLAADTSIVCTLDGDGSLDPRQLPLLVDALDAGADVALGRRRPESPNAWPWHARAGTLVAAWRLRTRYGIAVHDIGPMRAISRTTLLQLDIADRRSGYPVEFVLRAAAAGLRITEVDVDYRARAAGTSKVSGTLCGSLRAGRDFLAVLS